MNGSGKVFSSANNSFEQYTPSDEELQKIGVLKEIIKRCSENAIECVVIGGYGLDGLYGKLTRDHHDIDLLIGDIKKFEEVLRQLGFTEDTSEEDEIKEVFKKAGFKVEYSPISAAEKLVGKENLTQIAPEMKNASLFDFSFNAPTLEGVRLINNIQTQRAKDKKWGDFPHKEHQEKIIAILSQRMFQ